MAEFPRLEFPEKPPYFIEVLGDISYYLPLPENVILKPSLIGAEAFFVEFHVVTPKRHPEESQGENIDDRLGTYIRSRARVLFPKEELPLDLHRTDYEAKALSIVNRVIETVRYVAFDHAIRRILSFDRTILRIWKLNDDGTAEPAGLWTEAQSFGPFGISSRAQLTADSLQTLCWVFNGLSPTNPAWHLVLDAKYHNHTGDIPRAILDLGTALEINIPRLTQLFSLSHSHPLQLDAEGAGIYELYDRVLKEATGHSLHEEPQLFAKLEYIRAVRNSIAHDWNPTFRVTPQMQRASKYLHIHRPMDGHVVDSREEVARLIDDAQAIIKHTIGLFEAAFKS